LQSLQVSELTRLPQLRIGAAIHAELALGLAEYLDYHLEQASKARGLLKRLLEG
jgi:hypothetical protein